MIKWYNSSRSAVHPKYMRKRANLLITREHQDKQWVLIFRQIHPIPEPDFLQTPGGTIEPEEDPLHAALREAYEETGLQDFSQVELIGQTLFEEYDEMVHIHAFHMVFTGTAPDTWDHQVGGKGLDKDMVFRLWWVEDPLAEGLEPFFVLFYDKIQPALRVKYGRRQALLPPLPNG
jgi:8-oxo-dGTP pyrophosphatase MutT (NUDIX family)